MRKKIHIRKEKTKTQGTRENLLFPVKPMETEGQFRLVDNSRVMIFNVCKSQHQCRKIKILTLQMSSKSSRILKQQK